LALYPLAQRAALIDSHFAFCRVPIRVATLAVASTLATAASWPQVTAS
jgi:hypothetical protein